MQRRPYDIGWSVIDWKAATRSIILKDLKVVSERNTQVFMSSWDALPRIQAEHKSIQASRISASQNELVTVILQPYNWLVAPVCWLCRDFHLNNWKVDSMACFCTPAYFAYLHTWPPFILDFINLHHTFSAFLLCLTPLYHVAALYVKLSSSLASTEKKFHY